MMTFSSTNQGGHWNFVPVTRGNKQHSTFEVKQWVRCKTRIIPDSPFAAIVDLDGLEVEELTQPVAIIDENQSVMESGEQVARNEEGEVEVAKVELGEEEKFEMTIDE